MKKRILSILLLCCMVLTLLPTAAFAAGEIDEQFTLAPGGTYYFDLSAMGIPGTVNDALPDKNIQVDRKSTRLNSSHYQQSRMPSSA